MKQEIAFLETLAANGGPCKNDYRRLDQVIANLAQFKQRCAVDSLSQQIEDTMGESFSTQTMQGFAYQKPHGYAGDFEIIERIYDRYVCEREDLQKWDIYWQSQPAANAVRNRKDYFQDLLARTESKNPNARILNIASGPARDMVEYLLSHHGSNLSFDCIDQDANAIAFAQRRCQAFEQRVRFVQANAFKYETSARFDLVWSAGLFDYFDDKTFIRMIRKLLGFVAPGGELVVGNFCVLNPSRPYMELFDWHLHHRSREQLHDLALQAGAAVDEIDVRAESENVNLFLHISKCNS